MRLLIVGAVAVGGAAGAVARLLVSAAASTHLAGDFAYGTLTVNVVGSFILGFVTIAISRAAGISPVWSALIGTGFCGGFTTFSTYTVNTLTSDSALTAVVNIVLNNAGAIGAAALGMWLGYGIARVA